MQHAVRWSGTTKTVKSIFISTNSYKEDSI